MHQARHVLYGLDVDDLRLGTRRGLERAANLGFRAIELGAVGGDVAPQHLGSSGRRELVRCAGGLGLELSALTAEMPSLRFNDTRAVEERVDRTCRILELARDLGVSIVTAGVGVLADPKTGEPSALALEALGRIGEYADSRGVCYALRPSYDVGQRLVNVLDALRCPAIKICLDPAAVVMTGANPLASIERFIEHVALFHARDGTAGFSDPHGGEPRLGHETPLGEGDVDFIGVIEVLREADYHGPYVTRRTDAHDPAVELTAARETLTRMM